MCWSEDKFISCWVCVSNLCVLYRVQYSCLLFSSCLSVYRVGLLYYFSQGLHKGYTEKMQKNSDNSNREHWLTDRIWCSLHKWCSPVWGDWLHQLTVLSHLQGLCVYCMFVCLLKIFHKVFAFFKRVHCCLPYDKTFLKQFLFVNKS